MTENNPEQKDPTEGGKVGKVIRTGMQAASALSIATFNNPLFGVFVSAVAGAWGEHEQDKVNSFFKEWLKMLQDEIREKEQTIIEIIARLDLQDEKISQRLQSKEYLSLLKKTFREWKGAESEDKRKCIRNILAHAASTSLTSDDVIRLFIDWIGNYSELHFKVIAVVYKNQSNGITRGAMWRELGKPQVREDSADADLFKLLIRDLNMGSVIRQYKDVDEDGNFMNKAPQRRTKGSGPKPTTSAFDEEDPYVLTGLGKQFVHYAMTDLPIKIEYRATPESEMSSTDNQTKEVAVQ
jgi:hypothetical protein